MGVAIFTLFFVYGCALIVLHVLAWKDNGFFRSPEERTVVITHNAAPKIEHYFYFYARSVAHRRHAMDAVTLLDVGSTDETLRIAERLFITKSVHWHIVALRNWDEAHQWLFRIPSCKRIIYLRESIHESTIKQA